MISYLAAICILLMLIFYVDQLSMCADNINTNVQQRGQSRLRVSVQVIIPQSNFTCDGRLNRIMASMVQDLQRTLLFLFQVWRPSSPDSVVYNKVGEITLREDDVTEVTTDNMTRYWLVNMSLSSDQRIEFQSGDLMGYYHTRNPRYRVHNNPDPNDYQSYSIDNNTGPAETFNISHPDVSVINRQPLFNIQYGKCIVVQVIQIT